MSVFQYASGPKTVDGLTAVPIHINLVTASIVFDGAAMSAECSAEMQFTVGPHAGHPYFDLRQNFNTATLDGTLLAVSDIAHHDFGGGTDAELRILERWLEADSTHTLVFTYPLSTPNAPNARAIIWEPGSARLSFDFHLSDLNPSRYLESWLPSNLLFDNFTVQLEVQIINSSHAHVILTNANATIPGTNHWQLDFPAYFASCSHMLLIEAADRVEQYTTTTTLSTGFDLTLELMKRISDSTLDLPGAANTVAAHLDNFNTSIGTYMHGNRFVAYITSGTTHSMEYDGGTTSQLAVVNHEAFHSWWARGMVPVHGEDGWLDEGWTKYNTRSGGPDAIPFDMSDPPFTLWTNNPFIRKTHGSSYTNGTSVFSGLAAELGIASLQGHMASIYRDRIDRRYTTPVIESELIRRSGQLHIAEYFDRFVYGFGNLPVGVQPDLYLRDASDDAGDTPYTGVYWLSPDIWVRNADDDGTTHQNPESGQDNWLYARVHNRGTATARSFFVGFRINIWAGTQFIYPGDWFPLTAVVVGFDLAPGETQIVKARWPKADIPPAGSHGCLLALVYNSDDALAAGTHVWEHNNLAQRNLTIVDMVPNEWAQLEFRIGSRFTERLHFYTLELLRDKENPDLEVLVTHRLRSVVDGLFHSFEQLSSFDVIETEPVIEIIDPREIRFRKTDAVLHPAKGSRLLLRSGNLSPPQKVYSQARLVKDKWDALSIRFDSGQRAGFPIGLRTGESKKLVLHIQMPADAQPGESTLFHLVQRDIRGHIAGGISFQLNIKKQRGGES